ncbi:MAG: right-handed parallel beta-helix repeat-containing protein [Angelakisella sp.]
MKTICAADYGILPDTGKDYTADLSTLFAANKEDTVITLSPGRYDFFAENGIQRSWSLSNTDLVPFVRIGLLLETMRGVVLEGGGAQLVYHGSMIPIALSGCHEVTVKNLTIDWDIPLSAEGQVLESAATWFDIAIDPVEYPHLVRGDTLIFTGESWQEPLRSAIEFDTHTNKVRYGTGDVFSRMTAQQRDTGVVRLFGDFAVPPQPGNWMVLRHTPRVHSGIFAQDSSNLSFQEIAIHGTAGLGVLCQFCENLHFKVVRLVPNPARGRRFLSGHDDGLHLSNNRGAIVVEQCSFFGLMDDSINVHGTAAQIVELCDEHTLRGRFVHPQSVAFPNWAVPEQEISFLDHLTLQELGQGKVNAFTLDSTTDFTLAFDCPIPKDVRVGDALENSSNTPSLTIRNCHFGSCRARGILITTPRPVLVENNLFESSGAAILLAGDANQWFETGACRNVVIRGNVFADCCMTSDYQFCQAILTLEPEIPQPERNRAFHRNICICDNVFHLSAVPLLYAKSTQCLVFSNNRIYRSDLYPHRAGVRDALFVLEHCQSVTIGGNLLIDEPFTRQVVQTDCEGVELSL